MEVEGEGGDLGESLTVKIEAVREVDSGIGSRCREGSSKSLELGDQRVARKIIIIDHGDTSRGKCINECVSYSFVRKESEMCERDGWASPMQGIVDEDHILTSGSPCFKGLTNFRGE